MPISIPLDETWFQGCASVERVEGGGLRPWRLPHQRRHLYTTANDGLMNRAIMTSGVRLRFATTSTNLTLRFAPLDEVKPQFVNGHCFDLVAGNELAAVVRCGEGDTEAHFTGLPTGDKILELWLPPTTAVTVTALEVDDHASAGPRRDPRPMWVTWGSSLTHCVRAHSASRIWAATVSRKHDLNLVALGFGGECHLDPTVAMYIRDLPADFISMKLGINTISGTLHLRTYAPLVTAAVAIIREKHPTTPICLVSPMGYPPHETTPNRVDYTISDMRRDMAAVHRRMVEAGDMNLHYVDGLKIFSVEEIHEYSTDKCHPNPDGIDLQAAHWDEHVMPLLLGR